MLKFNIVSFTPFSLVEVSYANLSHSIHDPPYPEAASTLKLLFIIPMNVFNTFTHFNELVFYYIV